MVQIKAFTSRGSLFATNLKMQTIYMHYNTILLQSQSIVLFLQLVKVSIKPEIKDIIYTVEVILYEKRKF